MLLMCHEARPYFLLSRNSVEATSQPVQPAKTANTSIEAPLLLMICENLESGKNAVRTKGPKKANEKTVAIAMCCLVAFTVPGIAALGSRESVLYACAERS